MIEDGKTPADMMRFVGFATVCVGLAWAAQILGAGDAAGLARLVWTIAAAIVCGAGVGLVVTSTSLAEPEAATAG